MVYDRFFLWDGAAFWFTPMARVVASPRALIAQHGLQSLVFVQKGNFPKLQKFFRRLQACKFEGFFECCIPYCHCQCSLQQVRKSVIAKVRKEEGWIIFHGDIEPPRCFSMEAFLEHVPKQLEFKNRSGAGGFNMFFSLLSIPNNFGQVIFGLQSVNHVNLS